MRQTIPNTEPVCARKALGPWVLRMAACACALILSAGCHEHVPIAATEAADATKVDATSLEDGAPSDAVNDVAANTDVGTEPDTEDANATDALDVDVDVAVDVVVADDGGLDAIDVADTPQLDIPLTDAETTDTADTVDIADGQADEGINYDDIPLPDIALPEFGPYVCGSEEGLSLFKTKVEPIVFGSQPKTCNQCHLAGIDLNMWVQDTPCQTMACMVGAGMVDFADPQDSKILKMIHMAEPESKLITSAVINTEYVAMLAWITYSAQCHSNECGDLPQTCGTPLGDVPVPEDVINPLGLGCTDDALVQSFHDRVYEPWKGRCHGCHAKFDDPTWKAPAWLVEDVNVNDPVEMLQGAMVSMYNLVSLGAMDTEQPLQSMLLLKPLKQSQGGVSHGGGDKFVDTADEAYQDFALFLEQYSACYHAEDYTKPVVTITFPNKYNKKFFADEDIMLEGFALDGQDGTIPEGGLIWHSDMLTDPLGFGEGPVTVTLPVGKQVVSLTAYDSDGNVAIRKLTIQVKDALP